MLIASEQGEIQRNSRNREKREKKGSKNRRKIDEKARPMTGPCYVIRPRVVLYSFGTPPGQPHTSLVFRSGTRGSNLVTGTHLHYSEDTAFRRKQSTNVQQPSTN